MEPMLTLVLFLSLLMALLFPYLTNPLTLGLTLLLQTNLITYLSCFSSKSVWFSYILFLIFMGAMLILFLYMVALASNERFQFSHMMLFLIPLLGGCLSLWVLFSLPSFPFFLDSLTSFNLISVSSSSFNPLYSYTPVYMFQMYMYSSPSYYLIIFIILYLTITLIVVVEIISTFFGTLRLSLN